jgi:hypothetical protein
MALGSITPDFTYNSEFGAQTISLELDSDSLGMERAKKPSVYVNGGPYFVQIAPDENVKTLAWYNCGDESRKAAIVECKVGSGIAILCGPHIEYDAEELENDAKSAIVSAENRNALNRILPSLLESNDSRGTLLKKLLERLGLQVNSIYEQSSQALVTETPIYMIPMVESSVSISQRLIEEGLTKDTQDSWMAYPLNSQKVPKNLESKPLEIVLCEDPKARLPSTSFDTSLFYAKWEALYATLAGSQMGAYLIFKKPFGSYFMYSDVVSSTQTILEKYLFLVTWDSYAHTKIETINFPTFSMKGPSLSLPSNQLEEVRLCSYLEWSYTYSLT